MKQPSFLLCGIAAAALALGASAAQAQTVSTVRIAIVDPTSGQELAVVTPGSEITMSPGQQLTLRLFQPLSERRRARQPIPAGFGFGPAATPLSIVGGDQGQGEVSVRLGDAAPGQKLHVGYKIAANVRLTDNNLRLGKIVVRVAGNSNGQPYSGYGYDRYSSQAEAVVDALYRAILLRAPDEGSAGFKQSVTGSGYDGAIAAAVNIANSPESRATLVGTPPEQRLASLYENLLGWQANNVDPTNWERDLQSLRRGDLAGVVQRMVRSQAFRYRFGY